MKHIITVQHTQSAHHTNGMVGSLTDWSLTPLGLRQAEAIADKLSQELANFSSIALFSSDLTRAKQVAELIGDRLGISPQFSQALRERNLGRACGQSVEWLKANLDQEEFSIDDRLFSDGESRRDVWHRLLPAYEQMMAREVEVIILVSHGDLLSVFNTMFLGLAPEALNQLELFGQAGGVSYMFEDGKGKRVIKNLSDMSYIVDLTD